MDGWALAKVKDTVSIGRREKEKMDSVISRRVKRNGENALPMAPVSSVRVGSERGCGEFSALGMRHGFRSRPKRHEPKCHAGAEAGSWTGKENFAIEDRTDITGKTCKRSAGHVIGL